MINVTKNATAGSGLNVSETADGIEVAVVDAGGINVNLVASGGIGVRAVSGSFNPPPTPPTELVAGWTLNETSGTRADVKGSRNLSEVSTVVGSTGKVGNAATVFNGSARYLTGASTLSFAAKSFSISCWVKALAAPFGVFGPAVSFWRLGGGGFMLGTYLDKYAFIVPADGLVSTNVAWDAEWHHLVGVYRPGVSTTIYLDNQEFVGPPGSFTTQTSVVLNIGTFTDTPGWFRFNGQVDEVAIWYKAITAKEVEYLYNNGNGISTATLT